MAERCRGTASCVCVIRGERGWLVRSRLACVRGGPSFPAPMPILTTALRRAAQTVLSRHGCVGQSALTRWTLPATHPSGAAAAGARSFSDEAREEMGAPRTGGGVSAALGAAGASHGDNTYDDKQDDDSSGRTNVEHFHDPDGLEDASSTSSSSQQQLPTRTSFAARRRRGRTKMIIVGEAEAKSKRKALEAAKNVNEEDPGMDGIRIALAAMEARRRQLYDPFSFDAKQQMDEPSDERRRLEHRQRNNEILAVDNEVKRYKEGQLATAQRGDGVSLPIGRRLLQGFFEPLSNAIAVEQESIRLKVPGVDRNNYGPFLLMLNPDKLAVITLHVVVGQLMKGEESFSPDQPQAGMCKFVRVVERLGEAVQAEVNLARLRQRSKVNTQQSKQQSKRDTLDDEFHDEFDMTSESDLAEETTDVEDFINKPHLQDRFAKVNAAALRDLTSVRSVARFARSALNDSDWGSTARSKVGAALTHLLLNTARVKVPGPGTGHALEGSSELSVDDGQQERNTLYSGSELLEVPAFYHDYTFHKGQKYGTISWHEAFYGFMDDEVRVGRFPNPGTTRLPTVRP